MYAYKINKSRNKLQILMVPLVMVEMRLLVMKDSVGLEYVHGTQFPSSDRNVAVKLINLRRIVSYLLIEIC